MPTKPVRIGTLHFNRKGDATKFLRNILYKYELGDKVSDDDAGILAELVAMHPEAPEKIGCGIQGIVRNLVRGAIVITRRESHGYRERTVGPAFGWPRSEGAVCQARLAG
jgi:Protein of unknown function (DUF3223)